MIRFPPGLLLCLCQAGTQALPRSGVSDRAGLPHIVRAIAAEDNCLAAEGMELGCPERGFLLSSLAFFFFCLLRGESAGKNADRRFQTRLKLRGNSLHLRLVKSKSSTGKKKTLCIVFRTVLKGRAGTTYHNLKSDYGLLTSAMEEAINMCLPNTSQ